MASQSLYRKWRSQTFSDLVGQEAIVRTLKNALLTGNPAHAYLFTGPRGTGKTSTARLLAKTINCLNPQNGEPCNVCQQCREITSGNSFNVIEIDAASNRGIDSIRELRDKVAMPPSVGKYKVYILDEAHMLTTEAFNALLKTLEEPPRHAIFVMATTDVHKMLPTVLSRCQRFDFKRITTRQIVEHLNYVAGQENVKLDRGAAELIARAAAGGMRDALSLLDQAIAYSGNEIALAQVQAMLGVADPRAIQTFVQHIARLESAAGLHLIHELAEAGADLRQMNTQIAEYWRALMLAKAGADIAMILDRTEDEVREITQMLPHFTLEELTECARIFAQNELMQKGQGTPQLGLELALLQAIEIHRHGKSAQPVAASQMSVRASMPTQAQPASSVQERPSQSVRAVPAQEAPQVVGPPPLVKAVDAVEVQASAPVVEKPAPSTEEDFSHFDDMSFTDDGPEVEGSPATSPNVSHERASENGQVSPTAEISSVLEQVVVDGPTVTLQEVKDIWEMVKRRIKTKKDGAKVAAVLNGCTLVAVEGNSTQTVVVIKASADFHYKALQKDESIEAIEWALKIELGRECKVRMLSPTQSVGGVGPAVTIPLPPMRDTQSNSVNTTMTPRQSAYSERSIPTAQAVQPAETTIAPGVIKEQLPPLARTNVVRENRERNTVPTTRNEEDAPSISHETRKETVEKKAKSDPVVQEVIRMFKADIKDIQLK